MANKRRPEVTEYLIQGPSLILKDSARFSAEHDRVAAAYRDLVARLEVSIFGGRDEHDRE